MNNNDNNNDNNNYYGCPRSSIEEKRYQEPNR